MNQRLLKNGENINSQDITLFCFPFAGGGASTYTSWIKKLKDKITVCPIQLPGREERIMEKPYTDMSELLRDLTDEIVIAIKGKYVLWGHSMGGKIAYELEKYLENKGYQAQCIFASGCRIPNIPEPNPIYHLKDEAFKRELERFGGTPKKVLENKELLDFFLPMLRADFTLADTYCDNSMTVLHSPTMYELGGVACHGYIEMSFDKVLDIKRLEIAWNKVIQKHDMLRAIVSNSGYQIVQEAVPYVTIQCLDLRITEGNNETDKNDFRRRLANKQYELGKWPMGESAEDLHINAVVAPVKKKELTSIHITNAEKENLEKLEKYYEEEIDQDLFERWINKSEEVVTSDIFNTFRCYSIFDKNDTVYSLDEIVQKMQIPEKLHKLTKRWLRVLIKEKVIEEKEGGYQLIQQEKDFDSFKLWDEFYQIENKFGYSRELVDYLKQSSDLLPELIQGKEDPLNILFPKGEMDPALAAYHDNQINKMLNDIAKAEIGFLCREKNQNKKRTFRILEVGAGVVGTSLDVIPSLDGMEVEYYFTDLSTFFLNRAQDNFGKYDWVKYGIFDINKEFAIQGYDEFSFDLILCANVLHNSRNIHDVMENLKGLLTDNGSMVILEETRTSYILLTSMEFKDGLTGFTDERAENEQTFFTRNQWESVFASHKGEIVFEFPSNESKLDLSGQTIYVTRFVNELEPIRKHDVRMYLEEQVSPYMVPANILVIPEIPLTSNRKVDTKAVKNYFMGIEETNKKGGTELPQTDLEKRIADIWCKELNISNIGRNDSFYLVGGDSLLIAQVIGKMLEKIPEAEGWEWSALLTEMMQTPTIKGIAEKIEAFQKDTDYVIDPCLVQLKKSVKENSQSVAKVLFHAGTGTLTPYNALLSYIEKDSKENEAIIGFTFGDDADYISMETSQTFRLLGEKYGKILNKLGYSNYILIGHCVGGLIALETAQYLQKKNVQVSDVTLISSNIPKQKNQTILSQATDEIYRKTLQSSLDNEILLERIFAKLIGADAYKAGYQVDEERLQQYIEYIVDQGTGDITVEALCNTGGKFEDVAKEFRLLASKSVSERLNALYNIIERPNGELMEHQLKMLNILFRVFSQNFRCVSTYEPKPYYGNMRILCCEIQGGHFYPGFFAEDYETWKPYAKGNLTFDLIKGWHLDCITEPNLGENIKKMLDFNY